LAAALGKLAATFVALERIRWCSGSAYCRAVFALDGRQIKKSVSVDRDAAAIAAEIAASHTDWLAKWMPKLTSNDAPLNPYRVLWDLQHTVDINNTIITHDAAIGFTGMDFETAVRERIPIMSILLNNFSMAIELKVMPISTEKYRSTDISGDYAAMARAFGGYGERVTKPEDIIPAIRRGIQKTKEGIPVLLEFITSKETEVSRPGT
jgi:acetolactate synthase-1/2/3 large subunit